MYFTLHLNALNFRTEKLFDQRRMRNMYTVPDYNRHNKLRKIPKNDMEPINCNRLM